MIPKPKHCQQNWLEMKKTDGGRICADCQKTIVDLTKKNWAEIESIHMNSSHPVCGMYTSRQLEYWGKEVPSFSLSACSRTGLTLSSFLAALNFQSVEAAPITITDQKVELQNEAAFQVQTDSIPKASIEGIVFDDGTGLPLNKALVRIEGTGFIHKTDETGRFRFEIQNPELFIGKFIVAQKGKYLSDKKDVTYEERGNYFVKLFLTPDNHKNRDYATYYGVPMPTQKEKAKHWWNRIFKKKKKEN